MPKQLSKKSRYLFEAFNWAIDQLRLYGKSTRIKDKALKKKEEVDNFIFPKKAKFFYVKLPKKRKPLKWKKGADPRIVAAKLAGQKGGTKTASLYPRDVRRKWTSKAGNTTLARYGKDYFKHIRAKRKHYPRRYRRIKVKEIEK